MVLMFNSKKGQFYVFVSILLCSVAMTLVISKFGTTGSRDVFEDIKNNYIEESNFVLNSAIYEENNISEQFRDFTYLYINHSKNKNVNFRILYFIVDDNTIYVDNFLDFEVEIITPYESFFLAEGNSYSFDKVDFVYVVVDDLKTKLTFDGDDTQLKMYFKLRYLS